MTIATNKLFSTRTRIRPRNRPRQLQVEALESRRLLTAGVTARLTDGLLRITGTPSNDTIVVRQINNVISIDGVRIQGSGTINRIEVTGGDGNDTIRLDGNGVANQSVRVPSTIWGGRGNDFIVGGANADLIFGGDGDDVIYGMDGNDELQGGNGNDKLYGGNGNDLLFGDAGDDMLWGGNGNDELQGGSGHDQLMGGLGNDRLFGQFGDDVLWGEDGDDLLDGGSGNDVMHGGNGNDTAWLSQPGERTTSVESIRVSLPGGTPQQTNKCGPNSAWRVMQYHGGLVTHQRLIDSASESSLVSRWNFGTTGQTLVNAMNANTRGLGNYTFSLRTRSNFNAIIDQLKAGKPVVAMITNGTAFTQRIGSGLLAASVTIPNLHWIAVSGFDAARQLIFYTETNGEHREMSYNDFNRAFDWSANATVRTFLQGYGVVPRTFIV